MLRVYIVDAVRSAQLSKDGTGRSREPGTSTAYVHLSATNRAYLNNECACDICGRLAASKLSSHCTQGRSTVRSHQLWCASLSEIGIDPAPASLCTRQSALWLYWETLKISRSSPFSQLIILPSDFVLLTFFVLPSL
jgi:hypothetical protein